MKYYVLQIMQYNDGSADAPGVYSYETYDLAVANFHSRLGSAMKQANVKRVLCMAFDSNGNVFKNESWTNPNSVEVVNDTEE